MAYLILPSRRTRQPQQLLRIDYANPLTAGLTAHFHAPTRTLNGIPPASNTGTVAAGQSGIGLDYVSGSNTAFAQQYGTGDALTTTRGASFAVLFDVDALTNYSAILSNQTGATANSVIELRLGTTSSDSKIQVVRASGGSSIYAAYDSGANRFSAGDTNNLVIVTFPNEQITSAPTIWAKRAKYTGALVGGSGSGAVTANAAAQTLFGTRTDGVTKLDGRIYGAWFWNRPLSDGEALALYDNIWQLYAPDPRRIYFDVPASAPTASYLKIPSRRTRQPQGAVRLNYSRFPLGKINAVAVGDCIAKHGAQSFTTYSGTLVRSYSSTGIATRFSNSVYASKPTVASAAGWTIAGVVSVPVTTNACLIGTAEAPGNATFDRDLQAKDGNWQGHIYDGAPKYLDSTSAIVVGEPVAFVLACSGSSLDICINGKRVSTAANNAGYTGYTTPEFLLGNVNGSASAVDVYLALQCLEYWPAAIQTDFCANPWDTFAPDVRRLYFGVSGGAGANTYNVTYSDSKSLTDTFSNLVIYGVTYSDTKSLADSLTTNLSAVGGYSESISLTDTDTGDVGAATYSRDVQETMSLNDSYTTQLTGVATQAEVITLQETYAGSGVFGVDITETVSLTDSQVQDSAKLGDITETISLSDSYSTQLVAISSYNDTIDIQDLYSSQAIFSSEITDSQSLIDAYSATIPGGAGDGTLTQETIDLISDEVMSRLYENPVRRM